MELNEFKLLFYRITIYNFGRYFLFALGTYLVFWYLIPAAKKFRIQNATFTKLEIKRDIFFSMITCVVYTLTGVVTFNPNFRGWSKLYIFVEQYGYWWLAVSLPILVILQDFSFYWIHRLLHTKYFHKIHKIHHDSTNPSPFSIFLFHPLEALMQAAFTTTVIFILPIQFHVYLLFMFLVTFQNTFLHLGLEFMPVSWRNDKLLSWINTSTHHNRHHSHFNFNFGFYFTFWDRIMGTENFSDPEIK